MTATSDVQSFGSPGWPGGYAPNVRCEWTIIAPAGERISMKFQTYDGLASQIESTDQDGSCKLDSVVFYDGKGSFIFVANTKAKATSLPGGFIENPI